MITRLIKRYEIKKEFNQIKKHFKIAKRHKSCEELSVVKSELLKFHKNIFNRTNLGRTF